MNATLHSDKKFLYGPVMGFILIGLISMHLNIMPAGIIGIVCLLMPMAFLLEPLGEKLPILKDYLGGSPLLLIFFGAVLVHYEILPPSVVTSYGAFMKDSGTNFLDFFICCLIVGAIFGIPSKMLLHAGLRYAAPVIGGIAMSCALLALLGVFLGKGWSDLILNIGFPMLGGGMGGGAVPMAKLVNQITKVDMTQIMSVFVPAVVIGNVFSIIAGALLHQLGQRFPSLTGKGQLMQNAELVLEEPVIDFSPTNLTIGVIFACGFYTIGVILYHFIPAIHSLAWMVLAVAIANISGKIPAYMISACYSTFKFAVKAFVGIVLLSIGIVFTDLGQIASSINGDYILMCATVVIGAILGAGLVGRLVGFYFIESAITAGLCMTNMGGTGDVAVLSAAKRMHLMPFARLSTSIGGAFIIFLCGLLARYVSSNP